METLPPQPSDHRPSSGTQLLAALVLVGGLFGCAVVLAAGPWNEGQAPFPYAWRDVALVHLLCAVPLTWMLTALLRRRLPAAAAVGFAVVGLAVGVVPFLDAVRASLSSATLVVSPLGVVLRAVPALGLSLWAALCAAVLIGAGRAHGPREGWRHTAAAGGLGVLVLLLPPWVHVAARCRHDVAQLGEHLKHRRFGDAQPLARGLLVLAPWEKWDGHPMPQVVEELDTLLRKLEADVAMPLPARAPATDRLERARRLAMLGRTEEAVAVLDAVREPEVAPEADQLRGTIYETRAEWETALGWYQRAREGWAARPRSVERTEGLAEATKGVAYCRRQLGQYGAAEAAYLEVLALAPKAETHFLLAQFYEDTQQADKARTHARRAMTLAPNRYKLAGEKLINKLAVFHFGCLGVFSAESARSNASLGQDGGQPPGGQQAIREDRKH